MLCQEVVDVYMEEALLRDKETMRENLSLLEAERESLEDQRTRLRMEIQDVARKLEVSPDGRPLRDGSRMSSYYTQLSQAEANLREAEQREASVRGQIEELLALQEAYRENPDEPIISYGIEAAVSEHPQLDRLTGQEFALETRVNVLSQKYKKPIGERKIVEDELASVRGQLETLRTEVRGEVIELRINEMTQTLEAAQSAQVVARSSIERFKELIRQHEDEQLLEAEDRDEINRLRADFQTVTERLARVEEAIYEVQQFEKSGMSRSVPGDAVVPATPDLGKRVKRAGAAFVGAFGLAVALGLLLELRDQQVRSAQDVRYAVGVPVLATIPHASLEGGSNGHNGPLLLAEDPGAAMANELRRVLTRIIYPPEGSAELNSCLFTSPTRGDGKTSIACNIAVELAQASRRVLLIDLNARQPDVEAAFGLPAGDGLGEVLCESLPPEAAIRATDHPNLFVLGPGRNPGALIGKLASRDLVEFLEEAEHNFEHVLIDAPPTLLMSDAKLVAPVVDGVFLIVGSLHSTQGMVRRCLTELQQIGANVVGTIVNGVRAYRGGYMRRNLELYHEYAGRGANGQAAAAITAEEMPADSNEEVPAIVLVDDAEESEAATDESRHA
jgi:capsular exopolysaccharide synthesis family protein